jgi:hypothetical protein
MIMPSIYPVPVQLSLTLDPPASGTVGIADPLDLTTSRLRIKPVAVPADLTAPWSTSDVALILQAGTDANHLQASTALTRFAQNGTDPSHWRQRVILVGYTLHGTPLSTELSLQGSVGDGSQVSFTVKRVNPIYPYTPTTYLYEVPTLAGGVPGEPMTQTWSITGDNETRPVKSLQGPGNFAVTYTTPGQKSITLTAGGPFSGWKPWTDSVTVPQAPPVGPIAFYVTAPTYNRPPATYRFAPNYPPLAPGERITGDPTWSVDGQPVFTGAIFYSTFTAAGPHTVTLSQPTTLPRLLGGSTTITVDPNQVPVGSIDCSGSYLDKTTTPKTYVLSCKAVNTSDPDGQIVSLVWTLPDVPYQKAGGSYVHYGFPSPQVVPVQMVLTDNSGGTATISTSVDLSTVR